MDLKEKVLKLNEPQTVSLSEVDLKIKVENFVTKTFLWLGISLLVAFWVWYYLMYLVKTWVLAVSNLVTMFWISAIGWLALVVIISWLWEKFSYGVLATLFVIFAILEGIGLTWIFLVYSSSSILNAFIVTSSLFFILVILWNVLKIDVTKWWAVLLASLIALIIWMIINLFWKNWQFSLILDIVSLVIFSWLVIYDMKVIKQAALLGDKRLEIVMALSLYLDFINIFITILRLFWERE